MEIIDSFLLGLIQGLTEFLPISSSGHLVFGKALLGDFDKNITFEVVVHFGTLCSILVYYRNKLFEMMQSLFRWVSGPGAAGEAPADDPNIRLTGYILLSMVPAMLVGFTLEDQIESVFLNPFMVSIMLLVTGTILYATRFQTRFDKELTLRNTFAIGIAQAFAILPGISRSGSTISLGLYLGMKREELANFSFLMVIPVIAGAMLLKTIELAGTGMESTAVVSLAVGFLTAFVSGYFALKYLIHLLRTRGIDPFAWYCWALGLFGLLYF